MPLFQFSDPNTGRQVIIDRPDYNEANRVFQEMMGAPVLERTPGADVTNPQVAGQVLQRGMEANPRMATELSQGRPLSSFMPGTTVPPQQTWQPTPIETGGQMTPEERAQAAATMAHGATLATVDELAGVGGGLWDMLRGGSFNEGFNRTRGDVLGDIDAQRARDPGAAMGMEIGGGLLTGIGAGRAGLTALKGARATIPSVAGRAGLESSAYGAVYGLGSGNTLEERLEQAGIGAAFGLGTGVLFGIPLGWLASKGARSFVRGAGTPLDEIEQSTVPRDHPLRTEVDSLYGQMRAAGLVLDPTSLNNLRQQLLNVSSGTRQPLTQETGGIWEVVSRIDQNPVGNQAFGLEDLDLLRQQIRNAPVNAQEGEIARQMVAVIDRYIAGLTPQQVVSAAQPIPPQQVTAFLSQARAANTRLQKANRVTEAFYRARNTGGANQLDNIRTQFRVLARDTDFMRGLTPDERQIILNVSEGVTGERILRSIERLAPSSSLNLLDWRTMLAGLGAFVTTRNPVAAGSAVLGTMAAGNIAGGVRNLLRTGAANQAELTFRGVPTTPTMPFGFPLTSGAAGGTPALEQSLWDLWQARRQGQEPLPFGFPALQ